VQKQAFELYQEAAEAERAAWEALRGALPGDPDFDQAQWDAWQLALRRTDKARKAMLEEIGKRYTNSRPGELS
jgi:hypothetical protein